MEMPAYKWPAWRGVARRMTDSGWAFVRRAGTLILASMVLVWALLYFPSGHPDGGKTYPERIAATEEPIKEAKTELERKEDSIRPRRKEIKRLARQEEGAEGSAKEQLRARREALEEEIRPTEKEIEPLKDKVDPVQEESNK